MLAHAFIWTFALQILFVVSSYNAVEIEIKLNKLFYYIMHIWIYVIRKNNVAAFNSATYLVLYNSRYI